MILMISRRFNYLRTQKKLSQQSVAIALGVSRQVYNNYELGKREPDYATLIKLADYFDVTTDYLLKGEDIRPQVHSLDSVERVGKMAGIPFSDDYICKTITTGMHQYSNAINDNDINEVCGITFEELKSLLEVRKYPSLEQMIYMRCALMENNIDVPKYFDESFFLIVTHYTTGQKEKPLISDTAIQETVKEKDAFLNDDID